MRFLLIVITTTAVINEIASQPSPSCSFSLNDIRNVMDVFIQNKNTANATLQAILEIQQDVISRVKCTPMCAEYCSDYNDYSEACTVCLQSCPKVPIDPAAVAQFARYYGGNLRTIQVMQLDVQNIALLTRPASPDSQYDCCKLKNRALTAMNACGSAIIDCTDVSAAALIQALQNMKLPQCTDPVDQEFRTNYQINTIYFSAEENLGKCETQYIDAYNAEMEQIYADIDTCAAQTPCTVD